MKDISHVADDYIGLSPLHILGVYRDKHNADKDYTESKIVADAISNLLPELVMHCIKPGHKIEIHDNPAYTHGVVHSVHLSANLGRSHILVDLPFNLRAKLLLSDIDKTWSLSNNKEM